MVVNYFRLGVKGFAERFEVPVEKVERDLKNYNENPCSHFTDIREGRVDMDYGLEIINLADKSISQRVKRAGVLLYWIYY